MNWALAFQLGISLVKLYEDIRTAWDLSSSHNGLARVADVIKNTPVEQDLALLGAQAFPHLAPELQAAAAALTMAHPNNTSWVQNGLNIIKSSGYITFGNDLKVDGLVGPKTIAAITALENKIGIPVSAAITDAVYNSINTLLVDMNKVKAAK